MDSYRLVSKYGNGKRQPGPGSRTAGLAMASESPNTSSTKRRAQALLKTQEIKEQKGRLECLLNQQFVGKFGGKAPNSRLNKLISDTVAEYVKNTNTIEPESLEALESKLGYLTSKMKDEILTERNARNTARMVEDQRRVEETRPRDRNNARSDDRPPSVDPKQWAIINAAMVVDAEDNERKKKAVLDKQKLKFKMELEQQRADLDRRKAAEKNEGNIYAEYNRM